MRCLERGIVTPATVAHHIDRHQGDVNTFLKSKLASLCDRCHNSIEQSIERSGNKFVDIDGWPVYDRKK